MRTNLVGFSPWTAGKIAAEINAGRPPSGFPGDFVFVAENDGEVTILSSIISAHPYFILQNGDQLFHGPTIFDALRAAGRKWEWNPRAVNCLAILDHLVGSDSLHRDVKRVEPCSLTRFANGKLTVTSDREEFLAQAKQTPTTSDETAAVVKNITRELLGQRDASISLSSGYDSRALLALALSFDRKPIVGTMGLDDSTDVVVARAICKKLNLEHRVIQLSIDDYFASAQDILRITSGTKSLLHWHTYLFAKNIGFPADRLHLAGSNGEFARSYYLDKGIISLLAGALPADAIARAFFRVKYGLERKLPKFGIERFLQNSTENFTARDVPNLCADACRHIPGALDKFDWFYAFERVRHFIGNGLALYSTFNATASPFLDARFIASGAALPRREKLNSRFHRRLIEVTRPDLLDFPVDDTPVTMRQKDKPLYWRAKGPSKGYSPIREILSTPRAREIILDSPHLDTFLPRRDRERLLTKEKTFFLAFLVSMHFLSELIRAEQV